MPGPPPKDPSQRRRRNAGPAVTLLPKSGRPGDPPAWPLPTSTDAELSLWVELWSTPQAVAWEQHGWTRTVARYARLTVAAEIPDAPSSLLAEVRQLEDRLGLSPMAMRRLLWQVDDRDEIADRRPAAQAPKRRLAAVDRALAGS
jgi:hypothetical protein